MYKMPNMSKIPNLPLGNYYDKYPSREKFSRSQTLGYFNGYAIQRRQKFTDQLSEQELNELTNYTPTITYPQAKRGDPTTNFVPGYVALDKKVLRFKAWFKETVLESPLENYRVRPVDILYYLIDDSMAVVEPVVENSGMSQGKFVSRHRVPKNELGDPWTWRDLNVGINMPIYGRVFHIYDCDGWTRDFLESEGYAVNPPQLCPNDPYIQSRTKTERPKSHKEQTDAEKLKQFLEMDRKVLRFYCVLDETCVPFGDIRKVILHYYLANDAIEVVEVRRFNDGRDPFPLLMSKQRVPKDPKRVQPSLDTLGQRDLDKVDHFGPRDFAIGKTVEMYNRRFFIYDCDEFTKEFYWKNFGLMDFTPIQVDKFGRVITENRASLLAGNGESKDLNTYEDYEMLEKLIPQPPKKDVIKAVDSEGIVLRYETILESQRPEDKSRRFVLSYRVADDLMSIFEPPVKNSGFLGGRFLEQSRVAKPTSNPNNPCYYGPKDFSLGATIDVFRHRFIIVQADAFTINYMQLHPEKFSADVMKSFHENIKAASQISRPQKYDDHQVLTKKPHTASELRDLISEVKTQLKKLAITGNIRIDQVFLGVDVERLGYVTKENIRDMCLRQQLPCDREITDAIAQEIGQNPDHITLEEFRRFLETN